MRFLLIFLLFLPASLAAQDEPSFIEGLLQDALSGDNRNVRVIGLQGALSSRATVDSIAFSDSEGVWLTISDAELDWSRSALLGGQLVINTLRAGQIDIARTPLPTDPDPSLPSPEAQPFELPEFPVSIRIGELAIDRLILAESVIGLGATLTLSGDFALDSGSLDANLALFRTDRTGDRVTLAASFENTERDLKLDAQVVEAQDGLVSQMLNLPGSPALDFRITGEGPLSEFTADVELKADNEPRVTGAVRLSGLLESGGLRFDADIIGDLAPLMAPQFRTFFGDQSRATLAGQQTEDGGVELSVLRLTADALEIDASLSLAPTGDLERLAARGRITAPEGEQITLPLGTPAIAVAGARFDAGFDIRDGDDWSLTATLNRLTRDSLRLRTARLMANGTLDQDGPTRLDGKLAAQIQGMEFIDPALQRAVGETIGLEGGFVYSGDQLELIDFTLNGGDLSATIAGTAEGLATGLKLSGTADASIGDLARFSGLTGRPLAGGMTAQVRGMGVPLSGAFDVQLSAIGTDLSAGIPQLDPLLNGANRLTIDLARDETGTELREFRLSSDALRASADGSVSSGAAVFDLNAELDDLGRILPDISGPVVAIGSVRQGDGNVTGQFDLTGPDDSSANVHGTLSADRSAHIDWSATLGEFARVLPQLSGSLVAEGTATRNTATDWSVTAQTSGSAGIAATLSAEFDEALTRAGIVFDAALDRIQRLVPEFAGTLSADGRADLLEGIWNIDADATGPGGIEARVQGSYDPSAVTADLRATGAAQLGLANPFMRPNTVRGPLGFDLALRGSPEIEALSGRITVSGATLTLPGVRQTLSDINAAISMSSGVASVSVTAAQQVRNAVGGRIEIGGPIRLTDPFSADLDVALRRLLITDDLSYTTRADGSLQFDGPLAGDGRLAGQISFSETEFNINSISGAIGAAPIPAIRHVGEASDARRTRRNAGLLKSGAGPAADIALDLLLNAPNRIFVRGRGLTAELGGSVRVKGSTARPAPSGQIGLIRGNFSLLGRRLVLDEGSVTLQGGLEPFLSFAASTETSEGTATIRILGPTSAPAIEVTSVPERPSEEALAMLLFGDRFADLSPVQIAQLASQLATLAGRGGGFIGRLREGLGVDTLDVGTDADGTAQVGVGAYLADGVYTDINVNALGDSEVNLNLDLSDTLTLRGSVANDGTTGLGLFFERDY